MKPSEWLSHIEGHGIYALSVLDDLDPQYREAVPTYTHAQTMGAIANRGLGGELTLDDGERMVWGYTSASALARYLLPEVPSDKMFGRGSGHRADCAALAAAGY